MGKLAERSQPFLGQRVGFRERYPTVESATVQFTESDGCDSQTRYWNLSDGPRIHCGNARCERGGYDIEWLVDDMIGRRAESGEIKMSCNGDEGTPKERKLGRECDMRMNGKINVKYKKVD